MTACNCPERQRPLIGQGNKPDRRWVKTHQLNEGESFHGFRATSRTYAMILCQVCRCWWKSYSPNIITNVKTDVDLGYIKTDEFNFNYIPKAQRIIT